MRGKPVGLSAAAEHTEGLQSHQPGADQLLQSWKERANFIFRIDDLDHHGEIPRRLDKEFAVDAAVRAETQRSVKDRRAGQPGSPGRLDNRSIKPMSLSAIGVTDERAEKDSILRNCMTPPTQVSCLAGPAPDEYSTFFAALGRADPAIFEPCLQLIALLGGGRDRGRCLMSALGQKRTLSGSL